LELSDRGRAVGDGQFDYSLQRVREFANEFFSEAAFIIGHTDMRYETRFN
jgi:hypothetical protein